MAGLWIVEGILVFMHDKPRYLHHLPGGALPDVANLHNGILDHLKVGRMRCGSFPRILTIAAHLCDYLKRFDNSEYNILSKIHARFFKKSTALNSSICRP